MSEFYPGWADAIALTVKGGTPEEAEQVTMGKVRKRWRIDPARLFASSYCGGKKGGKAKKERRK